MKLTLGFLLTATFGIGLGETLQPALQGFVTFATGSQRNTRVFTILAVADTAAELVAGPLTAALMAIGRTDDHPSDGLCFLASSVCSLCYFLSGVACLCLFESTRITDRFEGNICCTIVLDVSIQGPTCSLVNLRCLLFIALGFCAYLYLISSIASWKLIPVPVYYMLK
jgi:hypothetical protein